MLYIPGINTLIGDTPRPAFNACSGVPGLGIVACEATCADEHVAADVGGLDFGGSFVAQVTGPTGVTVRLAPATGSTAQRPRWQLLCTAVFLNEILLFAVAGPLCLQFLVSKWS